MITFEILDGNLSDAFLWYRGRNEKADQLDVPITERTLKMTAVL
jgi:hypothetical protein